MSTRDCQTIAKTIINSSASYYYDDNLYACLSEDLKIKPRKIVTSVKCNVYKDCFNCSSTAGQCYWDTEMNSCIVLNKDLTANIKRNWPKLFTNCSDDRQLCSSKRSLPNITYREFPEGKAKIFSVGTISNQLTDLYLPKGYVCDWTFTTDPKIYYQFSVRIYDRVTQSLQTIYSARSNYDQNEDFFLWNFGASIGNFRINYPKDMQIYVRNQDSKWNQTMEIII